MAKEHPNFTKAYEELEGIVAAFERGDIDLERDLPKFERGMELAKACRGRLKDIEQRIRTVERTFEAEEKTEDAK